MNDLTRIETIEQKIDKGYAGEIAVSSGGIQIVSMKDVMEIAKLMAVSAQAVPPHLRGQPGMCLGVCIQAIEWKMSPFAVANKSYVVNDRLAFESQLLHSVIEARAPLSCRLRCKYEGEGEDRTCTVIGLFKGETEPHEYTSPKLKSIKKHSPLWTSDPDQQLWFFASRSWARKWCPEVLLGIYTPEEAEQFEVGERAKDVSPNLMDRLPGRMSDNGFNPDIVQTGLADHAPRAKNGRRKAKAAQPVNIVPPAETAPSEPAGPSIPVPDATRHADADSPAASPTSGTGAIRIPESADEYIVYAEHWISQSPNASDAYQRWDGDMDLRDELQVPIKDRNALLRHIEETFGVRK